MIGMDLCRDSRTIKSCLGVSWRVLDVSKWKINKEQKDELKNA